eukprot:1166324-Pyramimonas_sp.AAC.1
MSRASLQFCGQGDGPTGSSQTLVRPVSKLAQRNSTITKLQLNWPVGPSRPGQNSLRALDRPRETVRGQEIV